MTATPDLILFLNLTGNSRQEKETIKSESQKSKTKD